MSRNDHRPSVQRQSRSAANAEVGFERTTAARRRGRRPRRRGTPRSERRREAFSGCNGLLDGLGPGSALTSTHAEHSADEAGDHEEQHRNRKATLVPFRKESVSLGACHRNGDANKGPILSNRRDDGQD